MESAAKLEWDSLALHRIEDLHWEKGERSFKGMEVAVVGRDERTGAGAFFVRSQRTGASRRAAEEHVYPGTSHTVVVSGVIKVAFGKRSYTVRSRDYFRYPAGYPQVAPEVVEDALMFTMIEAGSSAGRSGKALTDRPGTLATPRWDAPALYRARSLKWGRGDGSFEGMQVAVVGHDTRTGATALFDRAPRSEAFHHKGRLHSHTSTSHTLILSGIVAAVFDGWQVFGKAGDYFRCPAGVVHRGSVVMADARMFAVNPAPFGIEYH